MVDRLALQQLVKRVGRVEIAPGVAVDRVAEASLLSSLADETPEGRSIVEHALANGVDPSTGSTHAVSTPKFSDELTSSWVLSRDERTVFFAMGRTETDIWLAKINPK